MNNICKCNYDSPSFPPTDEERRQCGCELCKIMLKEEPVYTNAQGGKQSDIPYRCDLIPPLALLEIAKVFKQGADKYGEGNAQFITVQENLNHALSHIYTSLGNPTANHLEELSHAACRIMMALNKYLTNLQSLQNETVP